MEKGKSFQNWDKNKKKEREVSEENKTRKALKNKHLLHHGCWILKSVQLKPNKIL
jgi:hypothetical protein